jgi:hypothetical protein
MEEIFPFQEGLDYAKLLLTKEGEYSVTKKKDAERIIKIMRNVVGDLKSKTITDATGCVGGDTINFALNYNTVHSIEINPENFKALENNVQTYSLKNVFMYNGNAIEIFNWNCNVLYVDPPWGGPDYKTKKNLDLYMSSKRIDVWFEEILLKKMRPNYIIVKLPQNFNFRRFNFLSNVEHIKPYRIRSYILVVITVHMPKN